MKTILVVDDRALNREFLATLLRYVGYRVVEAADGAEALQAVQREHPALVVSDVLMPIMDGIEFAKAVRADPAIAATPIIFYTATYRMEQAQAMAESCGVDTVLSKPVEPQAILDAVQAHIGPAPGSIAPATEAPAATPARRAGDAHSSHHATIAGLQHRLHQAFGEGMQLIGDDGELRASSDHLLKAYGSVQSLSLRLAAVLEFGLELADERDPERLLRMFCGAGQNVVNAHIAAICIDIDHARSWRFVARGMPQATVAAITARLDPRAGLLGSVFTDGRARRAVVGDAAHDALELPPEHPPVEAFIAVPLLTGRGNSGWMYLANRIGGGAFNADDEQFATTLAAQLAPAYENLMLYDEVQQYASRLEAEIDERKASAARLGESELRFRQLAETINEVFFLVEPATRRLLYLSPAYKRIWGRSRAQMYRDIDTWTEHVHPDDRARAERELTMGPSPGQFESEFRILRPDGAVRWVRARGFPVLGSDGEVVRIAGSAEDITERREHQTGIARLSRIYAVLSGINSAIVRIRDRDELMQEACRIAVEEGVFQMAWIGMVDARATVGRMIAWYGGDQPPPNATRFSLQPDSAERDQPASRALRERRPVICNDVSGDPVLARSAGSLGCGSLAAFPLLIEGRAAAVLVLCAGEAGFFDAQELRLLRELAGDIAFGLQYIEKEENLNYLAYYDALTGLANSTLFHDRLIQFLHNARPVRERVAVILIDIERFAQINDSMGRQVGDSLLRMVAERLDHALDEPYSVARIAADMFAIAVGGLRRRADAALVLHDQVLRALELPFVIDGTELQLAAKAGVALYPTDGEDASTLFKNAEAALKQAEATGERFLYYARQMNAEVSEKLALETRLRKAIERDQFTLHYQPKVDTVSGRIVGLEALVRWDDPERGLMTPGHFIPLLEETGLIVELGDWALQRALADHRRWSARGLRPPRIGVNVSAMQLHRSDFAERVLRLVSDSGVGADALELEITESVIMQDLDAGIRILTRLREAGVHIAVDDFGTGYSSLRYLAKLPLDSLKIDQSFVFTMLEDSSSMAIVSMVISLAHALKLDVVAEGVDAAPQIAALRRLGCDQLQGFLLSMPVSEAATARLLAGDQRIATAIA
jgi:diguanylate cyclase